MWSTLFAILLLGLLAMLWLSGARAREQAVALARKACEHEGYQFLDDSVALTRVAPRWTADGWVLRRMYRFEYSVNGALRDIGHVLLLGRHLESIHLQGHHTIEQRADDASSPIPSTEGKVIPFPRHRRRGGPGGGPAT